MAGRGRGKACHLVVDWVKSPRSFVVVPKHPLHKQQIGTVLGIDAASGLWLPWTIAHDVCSQFTALSNHCKFRVRGGLP